MKFNSGDKIGHFSIVKLLGEGGMGAVYEAIDVNLDRHVALKVLTSTSLVTIRHQSTILDEAKRAAKINSPYVVKVWEVSATERVPFIAMELANGPGLHSMIPIGELSTALKVIQQIGEGILAAHQQGIVHRDLKPENIRMGENAEPKILDFGLSQDVDSDTLDISGTIAGTLHYLSPEQLAGGTATFQSDLFSFGTICYELLTGSKPFEGAHPASIIYSILHEDPISPSERRREIPDWIDAFIGKLHAKSPEDRFHDMKAALEFFDASCHGARPAADVKYKARTKSVTVVDLRNLSGDSNWDYFCQGFTEDVIRELGRRTDLTVIAEPSTKVERDIREVFKRCRTDYVVSGSILPWQESVRLNLAIYGNDGTKLLAAENFEGRSGDLFKLLASAAEQASVILAKESGGATVSVLSRQSTDITAYDCYLRAKNYYQTSTAQGFTHAIHLYVKALEIDPNFALAHAGLSDVFASQYMAWYDRSKERIEQARQEAEKALTIAPNLPEAHRSLGRYFQFVNKPSEAERCFLRAVEYEPKYALAYRTLGWLKRGLAQYDEAEKFTRKALELASTDLETLLLLGLIQMDKRQFTPAVAAFQRAIELGPDYGRAYYNLGFVYVKLGVFDLALDNFLNAMEFKGDPNCYTDAGYLYLALGKYHDAREKLYESIRLKYLIFVAHYYLGLTERLDGDFAKATSQFEMVREMTQLEAADPHQGDVHTIGFQAMSLAALGKKVDARQLLTILEQRATDQGEVLYSVARAYALLGDSTRAQQALEHAFRGHAGPTPREVAIDPHFAKLKV